MKKIICEVDEDYFNELCEAFKKKPLGGIPTHRAWALLEGLKNGIVLDGLTNGEVAERVFDVAFSHIYLEDLVDGYGYASNDECLICDHNWFDRKWGDT